MTTPSAVDPSAIPEKMTRDQLEWWILFTIAVAGKSAKGTEIKMREFISQMPLGSPFLRVKLMVETGTLNRNLRKVKIGKYKLLTKGFKAASKLDLDALETADPQTALQTLSAIPGLGPKGSRMILMYAYPHHANSWVVLDVHILRWLREQGFEAPKQTPPEGPTYHKLEALFKMAATMRNLTTRQLDTEIWTKYSLK
jgi:hypothetical protein